MGYPAQPSEKAAVVATIDPQDPGAGGGTLNSDFIDMSKFGEVLFVFQTGTITGTVDCTIREADDTVPTTESVLTGKTATQLAGTKDTKQVVINVKADELSAGRRYVRGRMVVGATGGTVSALGLGMSPRHGPASDDDLADVDEIVT